MSKQDKNLVDFQFAYGTKSNIPYIVVYRRKDKTTWHILNEMVSHFTKDKSIMPVFKWGIDNDSTKCYIYSELKETIKKYNSNKKNPYKLYMVNSNKLETSGITIEPIEIFNVQKLLKNIIQ